jgi:hypothetical protein
MRERAHDAAEDKELGEALLAVLHELAPEIDDVLTEGEPGADQTGIHDAVHDAVELAAAQSTMRRIPNPLRASSTAGAPKTAVTTSGSWLPANRMAIWIPVLRKSAPAGAQTAPHANARTSIRVGSAS